MRVNADVMCPGCKMNTQVGFKYPGVCESTVFRFECVHCKSIVFVRARRPKDWAKAKHDPPRRHRDGSVSKGVGQIQRQVEWSVKIERPSQLLAQLLAEEAAHNAKPVEQLDAESSPQEAQA